MPLPKSIVATVSISGLLKEHGSYVSWWGPQSNPYIEFYVHPAMALVCMILTVAHPKQGVCYGLVSVVVSSCGNDMCVYGACQ